LSRIASVNEEQLQGLVGLIQEHGSKVTGELIVTTLPRFNTLVTSWMAILHKENPGLRINLISEDRALKLEYGEANLAIRAGSKPTDSDNIVKHLLPVQFGMYAHKNYVKEMGKIQSSDDISSHKYVLNTSIPIMSMNKWIADNIPLDNVVFKSSDDMALEKAVIDGMGIGLYPTFLALENKELELVLPLIHEWRSDLWVVTHVDLHRTAKVKACSDLITKQAQAILTRIS
jgi:DNA-binding transcriptional LysR family regulator